MTAGTAVWPVAVRIIWVYIPHGSLFRLYPTSTPFFLSSGLTLFS